MNTRIRNANFEDLQDIIKETARVWKNGGLAAFPTETVYGLGGDGLNPDASRKIYEAKGRPSDNPLILHIAERSQLDELVTGIDEKGEALMDAFWPGPLTIIFNKSEIVPYETTGGLETVAIRMPSHSVAHALLKGAGIPIAAPSANLSGRPSPTKAEHVIEDMNGRIDLIIDGGEVGIGIESTIVDMTGSTPMILRPGYITREMLENVLGSVEVDQAVTQKVGAMVRPKAPGMKYRHYAPKAPMTIVEGKTEAVIGYINQQIQSQTGKKIGVLATEETRDCYPGAYLLSVGTRTQPESIAHNLFGVLRQFDKEQVDMIYSESFSGESNGSAVMNRLLKAAGHQIVHIS